jgi:3-methyladenine DNA glycosylase AlkD
MKAKPSPKDKYDSRTILKELRDEGDPRAVEGMQRFGIMGRQMYGVSLPKIRALAKKLGRDHSLAIELWGTGVHEARILASMVEAPKLLTKEQMETWVRDFDSWDLVDHCCGNLFDKTIFAFDKAKEWSGRKEEFEKRAGFALMAELAVHDKDSSEQKFEQFLTIIEKTGGDDPRNFVRKAVNWALRQIGKRNSALNAKAIKVAEAMLEREEAPTAKWIATDAVRELKSEAVQKRLRLKKS